MFLCIYLSSTIDSLLPYILFSPSVFLFAFIFFLIFPFLFLFSVLTLPFLILSFASLFIYYFSIPYPFFFNLDTLKRYPSKRASLINIVSTSMVYSRPYLVYSILRTFLSFSFFSYTYSSLPIFYSYFTLKISNFPVSLERKLNLMAATCPRKDFDPKREFVFLPCMSARQPSSRT